MKRAFMILGLCAPGICFVPLSPVAHAMGKSPTLLMGSMGDSITAGTLADTSATATPPEQGPVIGGEIGATDITRSINSRFLIENKGTWSWASGQSIQSHFIKLKGHLNAVNPDAVPSVLNVAIPGNETADLLPQAQKLVDEMATGKYERLAYLTFFIGNNDACDKETQGGTPLEEMRQNLRVAFQKLAEIQQSEPIRILMSGTPNIAALGREEIRKHSTLGVFTCEYIRSEVLKFCNPLTHWGSEEEYAARLRVLEDKNRVLREAAEEASSLHRNLEIRFTDVLYRKELPIEILAADCFHPNGRGQEELSEALWGEQPWFK